jgi:hypothetical protein
VGAIAEEKLYQVPIGINPVVCCKELQKEMTKETIYEHTKKH